MLFRIQLNISNIILSIRLIGTIIYFFCTFRSRSCLIEPFLKTFSMETMREKFPWTKLLMLPDGLIFIPSLHPFLRYHTTPPLLFLNFTNEKGHIFNKMSSTLLCIALPEINCASVLFGG